MKKTTKKWMAVLSGLLVFAGVVFADEGLNISAGTGAAITLLTKPYVYEDVSLDYEFGNGIALGGGVKVYENIRRALKANDFADDEAWGYVIPYTMFQYKCFTAEAGANLFPEADGNLFRLFFFRLGGDVPLFDCGPGKIGIDFGLETWLSRYAVALDSESSDAAKGFIGAFGTAFGTLFNIPKATIGLKYYLPL